MCTQTTTLSITANQNAVQIAAPSGPITAAQTGQFPSMSMPSGSSSVSYTTVSSSPQPVTATPDPVGAQHSLVVFDLDSIFSLVTRLEVLPLRSKTAVHCRSSRLLKSFATTSVYLPELTPEVVTCWASLQQVFSCHAAGVTGAEF